MDDLDMVTGGSSSRAISGMIFSVDLSNQPSFLFGLNA